MDDLRKLEDAKRLINQQIKDVKRQMRERDGNWFKRAYTAGQLAIYRKLQRKFEGQAVAQKIECDLDKQLDRIEELLDKAIEGDKCSLQV